MGAIHGFFRSNMWCYDLAQANILHISIVFLAQISSMCYFLSKRDRLYLRQPLIVCTLEVVA